MTGHTGFKGSWLCHWLLGMGAEVSGYSLSPTKPDSMYASIHLADRMRSNIGDLADRARLQAMLEDASPDIIFHLAAQPLVLASYTDPVTTFATNIMGTINLLEAVRDLNRSCDLVIVTSDKCYLNREDRRHYSEEDQLGGVDPYSASKACAEIVTASYRSSFFSSGSRGVRIKVASARAGNVIGGGDWANDRLLPDVVRAWVKRSTLVVRNPDAIRPWQHVLEPLSGYLLLAERMNKQDGFEKAWNFGPDESMAVGQLLELAQRHWSDLVIGRDYEDKAHEAGILMLDSSAAIRDLGWSPRWNIETAIQHTFSWYEAWRDGADMSSITSNQIDNYSRAA